jgi:(S)-2-hydroxyglutarate dehydrogenase
MYDIVIIGGGIVGLATGLKLKEKKPDLKIAILEKENKIALHQTGNNSGVIHAGVYYKPGSLKAINCRRGYQMLIDFCRKENVKYELCGKLIVAVTREEIPRLDALYERSIQNGLTAIKRIGREEIKDYEPHATGLAAIHVPYTGIIDYTEVSEKYAEIFTGRFDGRIFTGTRVTGFLKKDNTFRVQTDQDEFETRFIVNAAGLYSDKIAEMAGHRIDTRIIPFRGEYMMLKEDRIHLVKNLIYPVPNPDFPFLGVHFTRLIHGGIEAGPNAVWAFKREGYTRSSFNFREFSESLAWPGFRKVMAKYWKMGLGEYYRSFSKNALAKALQMLVPEVQKDDLVPAGAGVRAQACNRSGGLVDDFLIIDGPGILNILNSPSPAATSSLSIGDTVSDKVINSLGVNQSPRPTVSEAHF